MQDKGPKHHYALQKLQKLWENLGLANDIHPFCFLFVCFCWLVGWLVFFFSLFFCILIWLLPRDGF